MGACVIMEDIKEVVLKRTPISQIISIDRMGDFYEVVGRAGGDILQYRIYDNGMICEE